MSKPANKARRAQPGRGVPFVTVVGGANLDIKVAISGATIPATSNPGTAMMSVGGVGRNIAHNLARLDIAVKLISAVGRDAEGDRLLTETEAAGVDVRAVQRGSGSTGVYAAVLDRDGELVIGVSAMDITAQITTRALQRGRAEIEGAAFLVADCNLARSSLQYLQQSAKQNGIPFLVEPVSAVKIEKLDAILRRGAEIHTVTPNRQQLGALTGRDLRTMAATQAAARSLHDRGVANVLIGLGPEGALLSSLQGDGIKQHHIPATQAKPQDVTGGGDAHVAGYVAGIVGGMKPLPAALLGQAAAGLAVSSAESVSRKMSMKNLTHTASALKRRVKEL